MQYHKYSLTEIENLMPWERDVYVALLKQHLEEEELNTNKMPKTVLKTNKADKLLNLEKRGLAETMVEGERKEEEDQRS